MLRSPIWIFSFIHGKRPLYVIQSLDMIPSAIVVAWSLVVSFGSAVDTETFWMSLQTSQRKAHITSSASDPQLGETGPSCSPCSALSFLHSSPLSRSFLTEAMTFNSRAILLVFLPEDISKHPCISQCLSYYCGRSRCHSYLSFYNISCFHHVYSLNSCNPLSIHWLSYSWRNEEMISNISHLYLWKFIL